MTLSAASENEISGYAATYFDGRREPAITMWALASLLSGSAPEPDELFTHANIDGPGDLGIDGYWLDESGNRLILIQAKAWASDQAVRRGPLSEFRAAAETMRDEDYVLRNGNKELQEAHPEILDGLLDDSFALDLYFITSGNLTPTAKNYAIGPGSAQLRFSIDDGPHVKEVTFHALSLEQVDDLRKQLLSGTTAVPNTDVRLTVVPTMQHQVAGDFKSLRATISATAVVDAYKEFGAKLFRLNPRGALGSNKVNKQIAETLRNDLRKRHFHLVNNGITAVCEGFTYDPKSQNLDIRSFQIVNGCQTTYTLWSEQSHLTADVMVSLALLEAPESSDFAQTIARATNSQSSLKGEDFASLDPVHVSIAADFAGMDPPWLYEIKRGESRLKKRSEQNLERTKFKTRRLSMRETAQACLCFVGAPIMAKYDTQQLFSQSERGSKHYSQIFGGSSSEQLLLPVLISRKVLEAVKGEVAKLGDTDDDKEKRRWLNYSRAHLVALIGAWVRLRAKESGIYGLLSVDKSREALASIEDWFDVSVSDSIRSIELSVAVAKKAKEFDNMREFFRSDDVFGEMGDWVKSEFQAHSRG